MATEKGLIDKQTAIKLLRGQCVSKYPSTFTMGLFAAADEIAQILEVDAVEVVRCKECELYKETEDWDGNKYFACHKRAAVLIMEMKPDDFCSYGERRTDETLQQLP